MSTEEWREVVGAEGFYAVSCHGNVMSLDHVIARTDRQIWRIRGGPMKTHIRGVRYPSVAIFKKVRLVHHLVAEAFIGPRPEGMLVLHRDDDPFNNTVENLCYGTYSQNMRDKVANGNHHNARKTHCKRGHALSGDNLYINPKGGNRHCLACRNLHRENYQTKLKLASTEGKA